MKKILFLVMLFFSLSTTEVRADRIGPCNLDRHLKADIKALEINPDESITIIRDTDYARSFEEGSLKKGQQTRHRCGRITFQGIKNGKIILEISDDIGQKIHEISPFTLSDYANTQDKEEEVWISISQWNDRKPIPKMFQQFMDQWISVNGEESFKKMLNKGLLKVIETRWGVGFTLKFFLDHGADVNATNEKGENALFRIIESSWQYSCGDGRDNISFLISNGIDIHHKNNQGKSIFDIAREKASKGMCDDGKDGECKKYVSMLEVLSKADDGKAEIFQEALKQLHRGHDEWTKAYKNITKFIECESNPDFESVYMFMERHRPTNNYKYASIPCTLFEETFRCFKKCPAGFIHGEDGECYSCDAIDAIKTTESECQRCSNRLFDDNKDICLSKNGPRDLFFDDNGVIHSCKEYSAVITSKEECVKCVDEDGKPTRKISEKGLCIPLNYEANRITKIVDVSGVYHSCSEDRPFTTSPEECGKCEDENGNPMRKMYWVNCGLIKCSSDKVLSDFGYCEPCSQYRPFKASAKECAKCKDKAGNPTRKMYRDMCGLVECPHGEIMNTSGFCYSCSEKNPFIVPKQECIRCPNRKYEDGLCVLKK